MIKGLAFELPYKIEFSYIVNEKYRYFLHNLLKNVNLFIIFYL